MYAKYIIYKHLAQYVYKYIQESSDLCACMPVSVRANYRHNGIPARLLKVLYIVQRSKSLFSYDPRNKE